MIIWLVLILSNNNDNNQIGLKNIGNKVVSNAVYSDIHISGDDTLCEWFDISLN